jgi:hypothetical protein
MQREKFDHWDSWSTTRGVNANIAARKEGSWAVPPGGITSIILGGAIDRFDANYVNWWRENE